MRQRAGTTLTLESPEYVHLGLVVHVFKTSVELVMNPKGMVVIYGEEQLRALVSDLLLLPII